MWQVLFRIPITFDWAPDGIPIYGFGLMLFLTYFIGIRLAVYRAKAEGVEPDLIHDIAISLFIGGIVGARFTYLIAHEKFFAGHCDSFQDFFATLWEFLKALPRIWDGGIILYGSVLGALVTWGFLWVFVYRKRNINTLQLADIYAPSIALGVCLGRLGCLCNGCCYGQVACESCPAIGFPLPAAARVDLTRDGYQTAAGFSMDTNLASVGSVESGHEFKGLKAGDVILRVNERQVTNGLYALQLIERSRLRGGKQLSLEVLRAGEVIALQYQLPPLGFAVTESGKVNEAPKVREVEKGSAAENAGLQKGDQIIGLIDSDGDLHSVFDVDRDLVPFLMGKRTLRLVVSRQNKPYYIRVTSVPYVTIEAMAEIVRDQEGPISKFDVPSIGFTIRDVTTRVGQVVPRSPADEAGLKSGDVIVSVNEQETETYKDLSDRLTVDWPRGENELRLEVERDNVKHKVKPFVPRTIGIHPTQIYESISMFFLFLVLLAFTPLRSSYGQVIAVLAIGYSAHRYLNELLRGDIRPGPFEMVSSVVLLVVGVGMYVLLTYFPRAIQPPPTPIAPQPAPAKG